MSGITAAKGSEYILSAVGEQVGGIAHGEIQGDRTVAEGKCGGNPLLLGTDTEGN